MLIICETMQYKPQGHAKSQHHAAAFQDQHRYMCVCVCVYDTEEHELCLHRRLHFARPCQQTLRRSFLLFSDM